MWSGLCFYCFVFICVWLNSWVQFNKCLIVNLQLNSNTYCTRTSMFEETNRWIVLVFCCFLVAFTVAVLGKLILSTHTTEHWELHTQVELILSVPWWDPVEPCHWKTIATGKSGKGPQELLVINSTTSFSRGNSLGELEWTQQFQI